MSNFQEEIYSQLPYPLQNLACSLIGRRIVCQRYGGEYKSLYKASTDRIYLEGQQLLDYQNQQLSNLFQIAQSAPFWQKRFYDHDLQIKSSNAFAELEKLPILTKNDVRKFHKDILVTKNRSSKDILPIHTSGTTGAGLNFWETKISEKKRWATWWRYYSWHGITRGANWCGYFGGRSIVPINQKGAPFHRINIAGKQILFSAYHLSEVTVSDYVKVLNNKRPQWLHGYPSFLTLLANLMLENDLSLQYTPTLVTTGAENLMDYQKAKMQTAFSCRVVQHYGLAESVANISERINGDMVVDEDFALIEFLPTKPSISNECKIVGTCLTNHVFPLIRYDTFDLAKVNEDKRSISGHWRVVEKINGRSEDYVTLPNGTKLGRLDHIFKDMTTVREAQIQQHKTNEIEFHIVKTKDYNDIWESKLLKEAKKRMGNDITMKVKYVDEIPKTKSGKLKFVISSI